MEKHCLEWFKMVKDYNLRRKLLNNYDEKFTTYSKMCEGIRQAVNAGFEWSRSPEGQNFWTDVFDSKIELKTLTYDL